VRSRLHERAAEVAAIDDVVAALGEGRGNALLIEARAGFGKSALVEYAVDAARAIGARILLARARHLESAAPFEVLRRLLGPAVEEGGGADALTGAARFAAPLFTPGADLAQGVDYGCQWLVAGLAEQSPLVLAVDDAHWADAASLRVLLEVQAEISVQPVLLVLASRPVENPDAQRRLATMAGQPDCVVLTPGPLSRGGVAAVVTETLGDPAHELFVEDCLLVSGGNAFYLHELLRPYRNDFRPDLQSIVTGGTMSLRRTMSWRLGELGSDAANLAQAAAVLGDGCSLSVAAALADVDEGTGVAEVARLEAASVLSRGDPIEFVHPLVRAAVEETLTEVEIGDLHSRAARVLWENDASSGEVVPHLVASPGSGDAKVARYLTEQGRAALDAGAVAVAAQILQRALAEPPEFEQRGAVLLLTARAERGVGSHDKAAAHLELAMAIEDRQTQLNAAADLYDVLSDVGRFPDLSGLLRDVQSLQPTGGTEAEVRLRAQMLSHVVLATDPSVHDVPERYRVADADLLPVDRGVDRYLLVMAAMYERTQRHGSSDRLMGHLRRATENLPGDAELSSWDVWSGLTAVPIMADEDMDGADTLLRRLAPAIARLRGAVPVMQAELDHRETLSAMRRGNFEDALTALERAAEFVDRHGLGGYHGSHAFTRAWIAMEQGDYSTAGPLFAGADSDVVLYSALGRLLMGNADEAVEHLRAFGLNSDPADPVRQIEVELEPHLIASHALEAVGDRVGAAREASRELAIRRIYGPRFRLALALRRQASFATAREAVPLLREAVALVERTPRRPVRARVLYSYGAALQRSGSAAEARDVLYAALDDSVDMGLERLSGHVLRELERAGARPRRVRRTGPDSLTEAQRKIAELAGEGLSNREIAEACFVTVKTVETHLAATYRKLQISGRNELTAALVKLREPSALTGS
jgi:DNA-binding NarL/FixJ family response regulator